jgi:hypothetical protein
MPTLAHIRGIVAGATILTVFGSLWCLIALAYWAARPVWSIRAGIITTIVLLVLCAARLVASKKIPNVRDPAAAVKGKRAGKLFGIIFGIEGGLIAIISTLLANRGLGFWIPIVVATIVGAHFLPLAYAFEVPLYYWTGTLSLLGVLGCLLIHDFGARVLCVGLVMAAVLWLSALLLLLQTRSTRPTQS